MPRIYVLNFIKICPVGFDFMGTFIYKGGGEGSSHPSKSNYAWHITSALMPEIYDPNFIKSVQ